jgi:predicted acetyltransferase
MEDSRTRLSKIEDKQQQFEDRQQELEDRLQKFEDRLQKFEDRQQEIGNLQKKMGPALKHWTICFKQAMVGHVQMWMKRIEAKGQQKFLNGARGAAGQERS